MSDMAVKIPQDCLRTVTETPFTLLQPTPSLHTNFLQLAKSFLDPLADDITDAQTERQKQKRTSRKRKRKHVSDHEDKEELLRMRKVYVDGFDIDQVWQQAKKVIGAATAEVERELPESEDESADEEEVPSQRKSVRFDDDGLEDGDSDDDEMDGGEEEFDEEEDDAMLDGELGSEEELDEENLEFDEEEDLEGDETPPSEYSEDEEKAETLVKDKFGLNDGFFSIDDFNKQTQFLENQDARGDQDNGAASDEEDIDWEANPLGNLTAIGGTSRRDQKATQKPKRKVADLDDEIEEEDEEDDDEDEGDGPTFGNMDLDAPEGASDDDEEDADNDDEPLGGDFANTNEILYTDFFAPPAQKASKKKKKKPYMPRPKAAAQPGLATEDGDDADEIQRTMSAVQRDLFDDAISAASDPGDGEALDPDDPATRQKARLSTHERAQLALRAEIRKLEAANVSAKPWYLSGEAVAATRPVNSLLEEDLDFERAGKPVPVITEEVSESIEELIKRRILAREFDEVIRRRPDDLATGDTRRGRAREELADTKPTQGLADEYEAEHLRRTDPNYVDTRTEALKAQHKEIEDSWAKISAQLDALSNWHYKPKPPGASLEVRVNAPTVSLEDARPSAGGEVGGATLLAPQEVYKPGEEGKIQGEVRTRGGNVVAKEEETREQKKRRRAREKERTKKALGSKSAAAAAVAVQTDGKSGGKGKKAGRDEVVNQLKKGGVRVVDNKGTLRDIEGNAMKEGVVTTGAANFKL